MSKIEVHWVIEGGTEQDALKLKATLQKLTVGKTKELNVSYQANV